MESDAQSAKNEKARIDNFLHAFEHGTSKANVRSVLIVDDEPTVRRMVSRSMTSLDPDIKIFEAENGEEALEKLAAIRRSTGHDPILIVTDLQMPVMDGWQFIDKMWKANEKNGIASGIPVVVLSASSGEKGFFGGTSIHGSKCEYTPLVAVAKEECIKPCKYDSHGAKGLILAGLG